MFAQVFPLFQIKSGAAVLPTLYKGAGEAGINAFDMTQINSVAELASKGITANPVPQSVISINY